VLRCFITVANDVLLPCYDVLLPLQTWETPSAIEVTARRRQTSLLTDSVSIITPGGSTVQWGAGRSFLCLSLLTKHCEFRYSFCKDDKQQRY